MSQSRITGKLRSGQPAGQSSRLVGFLLLLAVLSLGMNSNSDAEPSVPPDPLPEIFSPFSWTMHREELRTLFPAAEIQDVEYTSESGNKMIATIVSLRSWKYLGEVVATIVHSQHQNIHMVKISTTESRAACFEPDRPDWCRISHNDELVGILAEVKQRLSSLYGLPIEYKGVGYHEVAGYPPDARETTLKWKREGFDLFLDLTEGEESDWAVGVTAVRRDFPP